MSKDLQTHALVSLPLKTILFDVPAQKSCKEKTLRKSEKTKSRTSLPLFQKQFHAQKYAKEISRNKIIYVKFSVQLIL